MFRRPPEFTATPDDPFVSDKLGRKDDIIQLTSLMKGTDTPLVMTLSAPWGGGKSSFVKMWKAYLESDAGGGCACIRFDAWKHDFNSDPLLSFLGEFGGYIKEKIDDDSFASRARAKMENCAKLLHRIISVSAEVMAVGSGIATFACPSVAPAMGGVATALRAGAAVGDKFVEYSLSGHAGLRDDLEKFRSELKSFALMVSEDRGGEPLYFFIDELDRCDPLYAIKLLESIKHFYEVPNIVFVLAVDRERLAGMVRSRYGDTYDEGGYLKRFVDLDYAIKKPDFSVYVDWMLRDCLLVGDSSFFSDQKRYDDLLNFIISVSKTFSMNMRDVEKALIKCSPLLFNSFNYLQKYKKSVVFDKVSNENLVYYNFKYYDRIDMSQYHYVVFLIFMKDMDSISYKKLIDRFDDEIVVVREKYHHDFMWTAFENLCKDYKSSLESEKNFIHRMRQEYDGVGGDIAFISFLLAAAGVGRDVFKSAAAMVDIYEGVSLE